MRSLCVREPLAKDEHGSAKATLPHSTRRRGGGRSGVQGQVLSAREVCPEGHQERTPVGSAAALGASWSSQVSWLAEEMPSCGLAVKGRRMSCSQPQRERGRQISLEELLSGNRDHETGRVAGGCISAVEVCHVASHRQRERDDTTPAPERRCPGAWLLSCK